MAARFAAGEAAESPEETPARPEPAPRTNRWVRVGGVVARSGRSVYAWIDERRVAFDGSHPQGVAPAEPKRPGFVSTPGGAPSWCGPGNGSTR